MHPLTDTALRVLSPVVGLLLSLWTLWPVGATAQVQIDQVRQATGQVQGASQAEVLVATGEDVSEGEVLDLIQDVSPPTARDGNSATVLQDGNRNDATIRQVGTGNRAVAEQLGSDNAIAITQDGGSNVPSELAGENRPPADAAFGIIQGTSPVGSGSGNLAVAVHEGSNNRTGIVQRGTGNRAGIRLIGDDNTMNLVQVGKEHEFLLDTAVNNEEMTVVQNGTGNTMDTTVPVSAEMNGNGMELVIRRDALGPLSLE